METYLPDATTRDEWRQLAANEATGRRADFWRELPPLPERPADAHKGTFGTALAIGGSRGMPGAIALTGAAALIAGAGLSRVAVPEAIQATVAQFQREYTTIPCVCDSAGRFDYAALESTLEESRRATAVAVGPGMGRSEALVRFVAELFFELEVPALFDADALNALAASGIFAKDGVSRFRRRVPKGPRVFTPHPGEFARLTGVMPTGEESNRRAVSNVWLKNYIATFYNSAFELESTARRPATLLLKGANTIITSLTFPKVGGHRLAQTVNRTGDANLATGGSGDVLTGVVLGLMAQGVPVGAATRIGAAVHGIAAELRATLVTRGALAGDVVRFLPSAFDYYTAALEACH